MDRSQSVSFWHKPDMLPVAGQFHLLYGKHNIYQSNFGDGGGIVLGISNNTLDDLRIYTKALTSTEVAALYAEPGILPASGPTPADHATSATLRPLSQPDPSHPSRSVIIQNIFIATSEITLFF